MNRTKQSPEPLLIDVNTLCRSLSVSRSTFFTQRSLDRIPLQVVRIGKKLLFKRREVEDWVNQGCPAKNWQWMPEKVNV